MPKLICIAIVGWTVLVSGMVVADDGIITKKSAYGVAETLDRLEALVTEKSLSVFVRVDHTAGAESVGIKLPPMQLLLFGNPRLGSQLMTSRQTVGLDLPMKALAWQDADGTVWLSYNDPRYLAARHGIKDREAVITKMAGALDALTNKAVRP